MVKSALFLCKVLRIHDFLNSWTKQEEPQKTLFLWFDPTKRRLVWAFYLQMAESLVHVSWLFDQICGRKLHIFLDTLEAEIELKRMDRNQKREITSAGGNEREEEEEKWLRKQVCVSIVFSKKHDCLSGGRKRRREGHLLHAEAQSVSHSPGNVIPSTSFLTADQRQTGSAESSTEDRLQTKQEAAHTHAHTHTSEAEGWGDTHSCWLPPILILLIAKWLRCKWG